ncbi:hypothetical protein [Peribacillus glennii]|uniref:hypothetical protein n=1 Tax=Peribacillus glennii TaxID=2303991 RepID=UPI001314FADD|nr:hypothetical protein [Peribacillus glennii]
MYTKHEAISMADRFAIINHTKYFVIHQPETTYEMLNNTGYMIVHNPKQNHQVVYETS